MDATVEKRLRLLYDYLKANAGNLVIDTDTHITDIDSLESPVKEKYALSENYWQGCPVSAECLIEMMDQSSVDMSLSWINPASVVYERNDRAGNYRILKTHIEYVVRAAEKYPERIIPSGWIDPKVLGKELSVKLVHECCQDYGLSVIKMNPAQNAYNMDESIVLEISETIAACGAVPAYHYGADTGYTRPEQLKYLASALYPCPVIAVHMGGGGASFAEQEKVAEMSRRIGLELDNIYYVESAKRDTHIECDFIEYVRNGAYGRLCCASDFPYSLPSWNYGGYRALFASLQDAEHHHDPRIRSGEVTITDDHVKAFMGGNIANLLIYSIENLLSKSNKPKF